MSSLASILAGKGVLGYPAGVPLASHDDVIRDRDVFLSSLRTFHSAMGTRFMIPVMGGKELDLHVLYKAVTKLGGYEKVVIDKKWKEISEIFKFPPTTTSASYALRRNYFSLLFNFEQAYFFRHRRPLLDATGPSTFNAVGTIEGKFECGYLISMTIGEDIFNGVLYHPNYPSSTASDATIPYAPRHQGQHQSGRRRRRSRRRGGDPGLPKPNLSGYNFFFAEEHSKLKSVYPNREREFTKLIGEAWSKLSPEEKKVYQHQSLKDKERYQKEMKEYKEKIKSVQLQPH